MTSRSKTFGLEKRLRNDSFYYFPNDILRELFWLWRKNSNATPQRNPIKIPQATTGIFKTQKKNLKNKTASRISFCLIFATKQVLF